MFFVCGCMSCSNRGVGGVVISVCGSLAHYSTCFGQIVFFHINIYGISVDTYKTKYLVYTENI